MCGWLKGKRMFVTISMLLILTLILVSGCSGSKQPAAPEKPTLVFADAGWDSVRFHNEVAGFIIENAFGYKTDVIAGTTPSTYTGLKRGDIDIYMETWTDNIESYPADVKNGEVLELSVNFDDDMQGLYVPTYVIKGDDKRGIKPLAPDLKYVTDLAKYPQIFQDPEDKKKGRIYGAIPGWAVDKIMQEKIKSYGLDKTYNYFSPGSDTALATSMVQAVEKGEPWVGYYWEPTWIIGKYDMTLLEEAPYDKDKFVPGDYKCSFPAIEVTIAANSKLPAKAPEVVEFLKKYQTNSAITSQALAYMEEKKVDSKATAKWFLQNNKDMWTKWLTPEAAKKVEEALK